MFAMVICGREREREGGDAASEVRRPSMEKMAFYKHYFFSFVTDEST